MYNQFKIHSIEALSLIEFARKQKVQLHLMIDGAHTYLVIPNLLEITHKCYLDELVRIRACQSKSSEVDLDLFSEPISSTDLQIENCPPYSEILESYSQEL